MGSEAREVDALRRGCVFQGSAHAGVPHRKFEIVLGENPGLGVMNGEKFHAAGVSLFQISESQDPAAFGRLRLIDVAATIPLLDSDTAIHQVNVLALQAGDLRNPGACIEAGLTDQ